MSNITPMAGDRIEGRCTQCRKNTDQIILSLIEEAPLQVQCTVCARHHKYRPPTAAKKSAVRQPANHKEVERKEWAQLREGMNGAEAAAYSMTSSYKVKALINHPLFGLGLVRRVVGVQKIEVLFEDGTKTMRCK